MSKQLSHASSPNAAADISKLMARVKNPALEIETLREIRRQAIKVRDMQRGLEKVVSKEAVRACKIQERKLDDMLHNQTSLWPVEEGASC